MVHDRISHEHQLEHLVALGLRLHAEVAQQAVQDLAHGVGQGHLATRVHHHVGDPAHQVLAEPDLGVHGAGRRQHRAGRQVAEVAGDGRGPHVDGHAEGTVAEAGPRGHHQAVVTDRHGDRASTTGQCRLEFGDDPVVDGDAREAPLVVQGLDEATHLADRLVQGRFRHLDQAQDENGVQLQVAEVHLLADHLPVDLAFGRYVDHQVAADRRRTGEAMGSVQRPAAPVGVLDRAPGRHVVLGDGHAVLGEVAEGRLDLAASADSAASTHRVQVDTQLPGGVQQRRPGGDLAATT